MARVSARVVLSSLAPAKAPPKPHRQRQSESFHTTSFAKHSIRGRNVSLPRAEKPKKPRPQPDTLAETVWLARAVGRRLRIWRAHTPGQLLAGRKGRTAGQPYRYTPPCFE
jgi:hypothetical protein